MLRSTGCVGKFYFYNIHKLPEAEIMAEAVNTVVLWTLEGLVIVKFHNGIDLPPK